MGLFTLPRSTPARRGDTTAVDYETLADLRYQIRRFLRVRELAARAAGVEPQQYLVLLQVKGLEGREAVTIGALAGRLQIGHHAAVQLVDRLERGGMVERRRDGPDRRAVIVALRPAGEAVLRRLALHSVAELEAEAPALVLSLTRLVARSAENEPTPARKRRETR
jgi:DNA-binding MarR family transcriptional regulator